MIGRVIKAMQANWHPDCFRCEICNDGLADSGFVKNAGRYLVTAILNIHVISCIQIGLCWAVPESTHTHPMEGHWKFLGNSQMPNTFHLVKLLF